MIRQRKNKIFGDILRLVKLCQASEISRKLIILVKNATTQNIINGLLLQIRMVEGLELIRTLRLAVEQEYCLV